MRVVWLEGIKGDLAEQADAQEASLLKRMNKPVSGEIVVGFSDDEGEGSMHEADGGSPGVRSHGPPGTVRSSFSVAPGSFSFGLSHVPGCVHRAR